MRTLDSGWHRHERRLLSSWRNAHGGLECFVGNVLCTQNRFFFVLRSVSNPPIVVVSDLPKLTRLDASSTSEDGDCDPTRRDKPEGETCKI